MAVAAGKYRHLVSLQRPEGVNEFNEPTKNFVEDGKVWAAIEPATAAASRAAHETLAAGSLVATDYYSIALYPYPGLATTWRVVGDDGVIYSIVAVRPTNTRDEISLVVRIGASNG